MNKKSFIFLALVLGLCTGIVGCKKRPVGITPLPGRAGGGPGSGAGLGDGLTGLEGSTVPDGAPIIPMDGVPDTTGWNVDRETFSGQTVYFDFDKSTLNPAEIGKLETVAGRMDSFPTGVVRVEGHCDERGTEEYNRALGERRALAVREFLIGQGLSPNRIETVSFGEDVPADPGHDQAAWAKNRRGEILLLTPPQTAP